MSRINTNVPSLIAQRILIHNNDAMTQSLERLSTGLRINKGKDDPAGLIASERMRAEMLAIQAAQTNVSRAINVVSVAESGLYEISNMMNDLEKLVDLTANESAITDEEVRANQLEIDAILQSIDRIAASTELQGKRLLNGDLGYLTSAVAASQVAALQINSARLPTGGYRTVAIDVIRTASLASLTYTGGTITGSTRTIEITGNLGTERLSFGSGVTITDMRDAVNQSVGLTGVSAFTSGTNLYFTSTEYGSSQYVRVRSLTSATYALNAPQDSGADAEVQVNGMSLTADGTTFSLRTSALDADVTLSVEMATQTAVQGSFHIIGGGAKFAITPTLNLNSLAAIGINPVTTSDLGDSNDGFLYTLGTGGANALSTKNFFTAQRILRNAAMQIATLRGRLGAFERDTLDPTMNSLRVSYENVAAAESTIRDTDFAAETANMTRAQILVQASQMVLGQANQAPLAVLSLLQ
jgi:flagellin